MTSTKNVLAVIMGGGRGTRLYPLTKERCKPAVPLAGKYRLVDIPISNCLNSGINRIFLLTQFNTASLHRHIQSTYRFDAFSRGFVDIMSAEQTEKSVDWYQGTADAVRRNLSHFRDFAHDHVLILSGDQLYRMDYEKIIQQHIQTNADVTIAAIPVPATKTEGLGLMRVDDALEISEFVEKPKDPAVIASLVMSPVLESCLREKPTEKCCLASMGIYVFKREVLKKALENNMADFGKEVIPSLLKNSKLYSYIFEGYWEDIGTVKAFFDANLSLTQPVPPFNFYVPGQPIYTRARFLPATKIVRSTIDQTIIGDGSIITDAKISRAVIGIRSVIRENSVLEDSIMMGADYFETEESKAKALSEGKPKVGIGRNCRIKGAIIDKNARIGDDVVLDPTGKAPNADFAHGVMTRDGVLMVTKNAVIPSGTII